MPLRTLDPQQVAALQAQPFTYAEVGATAEGRAPVGYGHVSRTRLLPSGRTLDDAAEKLLAWRVQLGVGLRVAASAPTVAVDEVVLMRLGVGALAVAIPCRVVYVLDEPDRRGFAYGTLPGHPESGEEAFVLHRRPDGRVEFTISAFSRAATVLARAGGPVTRVGQRLVTERYLRTLDR